MKTEELNALKAEVEALRKKLAKLTEDELQQVTGGVTPTSARSWLSNASRDAQADPGQVRIRVIREGTDRLSGSATDSPSPVDA